MLKQTHIHTHLLNVLSQIADLGADVLHFLLLALMHEAQEVCQHLQEKEWGTESMKAQGQHSNLVFLSTHPH